MTIEIIAECGINHRGDMKLAREMIDIAKSINIKIVKFQLYDVDALFPDKQIIAQNRNWYEEVKKTQLTKEQVFELAGYCREVGIEFFASAFDLERLSWLEEVGVKRHKIATRMNQTEKYIIAVRKLGKPIIFSTNLPRTQISFWYNTLYCIPKYPAQLSDLEFNKIKFMNTRKYANNYTFDGFSDHTIGPEASMIAMARGATIIEKHFCLKRDNSNPDMVCSIEPNELKELVEFARKVEEVL